MPIQLYDPFEKFDFNSQTCFLTGENLNADEEQITVFPQWILDRYSLRDKKFSMMDNVTELRYRDIKIPCAKSVIETALIPLENEIKNAFAGGYDEVVKVPEIRLFQWMAKLVYGVLCNDLILEQKRSVLRKKEFQISASLKRRFRILHLMLQSLVIPMEFSDLKPWSIRIVKINISKDVFNYKDEPTNLNFSLGMNDFGIVACLQDNGAVGNHEQDIIQKISGKTLHPVQFEELCGRFIYTNYLIKGFAAYNIQTLEDKVKVAAIPLVATDNKPLFGTWDEDMFAQVLADYWRPWGITKKDIYEFPNSPISYLENEYDHSFVEPDSITLPF